MVGATTMYLSEEQARLVTESQKTWQALLNAEQADEIGNMMIILARFHHFLESLASTRRSPSRQKEWEKAINKSLHQIGITLDDYRRVFRKQHLGYARQNLDELRNVRLTRLAIYRVQRWVKEAGVTLEEIGTTQQELDGYLAQIKRGEQKTDRYIPLSGITLPTAQPAQPTPLEGVSPEEPELKAEAQPSDTIVQRFSPMMPEEDDFESRATTVFEKKD